MAVLSVFAYYLIHSVGAVLIYAALFLYKDEERQIQDRINDWQIRVKRMQMGSRSHAATFMREVARLTIQGFNRLFGERLFSLRFVAVSVYLSLASFFLWILILFGRIQNPGTVTRHGALIWFLIFFVLALVPAFDDSWFVLVLWWFPILVALVSVSGFLLFVYGRYGAFRAFRGVGVALVPFVVSLLCDFAYIVLTRWILRRISAIDHIYEIVLMIVVNLALVAAPVVGTIYIGLFIFKFAPNAGAFTVVSILFNSINLFAGLAALLLALFLLLHRLFWPVVHRPLYAVHRFALLTENKKLLFSIGVALVLVPRPITLKAVAKYLLQRVS